MSEQVPGGGVELSPSETAALDVRWSSCWTPGEVAQLLAGLPAPWCVAAGWALDLFRGVQTRGHGDVEIAIPAAHFPEVRDRFPGYVFDAVSTGRIWENAAPGVLAAMAREPVTPALGLVARLPAGYSRARISSQPRRHYGLSPDLGAERYVFLAVITVLA